MEFTVEKFWASRHRKDMVEQRQRILTARENSKAEEAEKHKWDYESSTEEEGSG